MFQLARNYSKLLFVALTAAAGCVMTKQSPKPEAIPSVKVDAETWMDGSNQSAVDQLKQRREEHIRQVLEQRREFEADATEAAVSSRTQAPGAWPTTAADTATAHADHVSDVRVPTETTDVNDSLGEPAQNYERHFWPLPTGQPDHESSRQPAVAPTTAHAGYDSSAHVREQVARRAEPVRQRTERQVVSREPTVMSVSSADAQFGLRLKGVILAGNNGQIALLEVAGKETLFARTGDIVELDLDGTRSKIEIIGVDDNSVQVRIGNEGKIKVIR